MYKHLTPQEIEEFEKRFPNLNDSTEEGGYEAKGYVLSFIDTLIGKRVRDKKPTEEQQILIDEYVKRWRLGNTKMFDEAMELSYRATRFQLMWGIPVKMVVFSPDSPKRNEEHDHPSQ